MLRADLLSCVYFWFLCSRIIIIRIKLTDRFTYSLKYQNSRVRPVSEIVYESRGKLIGGSLSRERKANSRPSENEGGDNDDENVLCPKAGSLAFMPPWDEMSELVSRCLLHRQLWVSNLSKVATQWSEVDSNPRLSGCKAQTIPIQYYGVPARKKALY